MKKIIKVFGVLVLVLFWASVCAVIRDKKSDSNMETATPNTPTTSPGTTQPPTPAPTPQKTQEQTCTQKLELGTPSYRFNCARFLCGKCEGKKNFDTCTLNQLKKKIASAKHDCPPVYTAKNIYEIYNNNEVRGDEQFKGKYILLNGNSTGVGKDVLDKTYVPLNAGGYGFNSVQLYPNERDGFASVIDKGDEVWASCKGRGKALTIPVFVDCTILAVFGK